MIDTPEAATRLEAFLEKEPHLIVTEGVKSINDDPLIIHRIDEKYGMKG